MIVDGFGEDTSKEDTKSHACIPRGEEGGIGGASLTGCGEVDEHVLKSRIHVAVSQSDNKGGGIEGNGIMDGSEEEVAEQTNANVTRIFGVK